MCEYHHDVCVLPPQMGSAMNPDVISTGGRWSWPQMTCAKERREASAKQIIRRLSVPLGGEVKSVSINSSWTVLKKAYFIISDSRFNLCHTASWRRTTFAAASMDVLPTGDGWQGRRIGKGAFSEIYEVILRSQPRSY